MPSPIKLAKVIKTLASKGFILVSQKGSHGKFKKKGKSTKIVIVKMTKKEIPYGTFKSILLLSDLSEEDFRNKKK